MMAQDNAGIESHIHWIKSLMNGASGHGPIEMRISDGGMRSIHTLLKERIPKIMAPIIHQFSGAMLILVKGIFVKNGPKRSHVNIVDGTGQRFVSHKPTMLPSE